MMVSLRAVHPTSYRFADIRPYLAEVFKQPGDIIIAPRFAGVWIDSTAALKQPPGCRVDTYNSRRRSRRTNGAVGFQAPPWRDLVDVAEFEPYREFFRFG